MFCLLSGGNWDNGSNAGVWSANLNNFRSNSNVNIGLRADCGSALIAPWGTVEPQGCIILRYANSLTAPFPVGQSAERQEAS